MPAGGALLDTQFVALAALPIGAGFVSREWNRFADWFRHQIRSLPRIAVQWVDMMPPCPWTSASLGVFDLARAAFAAQLAYRLGDREHRTGMARMAMREQTAVGVDREFAAEFDAAALDEAPAFALGAEAEVLEFNNNDRGEAVVKFGDVDIRGARPAIA